MTRSARTDTGPKARLADLERLGSTRTDSERLGLIRGGSGDGRGAAVVAGGEWGDSGGGADVGTESVLTLLEPAQNA